VQIEDFRFQIEDYNPKGPRLSICNLKSAT
jgi:hypothetical protein